MVLVSVVFYIYHKFTSSFEGVAEGFRREHITVNIDFWRQAVAVLEYVAVWYAPENGFPEAPHITWYFQWLLLRYPAQLEGVFLELPECWIFIMNYKDLL